MHICNKLPGSSLQKKKTVANTYSCTVELLVPLLLSDMFFKVHVPGKVKSPYLQPVVREHLSQVTATTFEAKSLKISFVTNLL